MKVFGIQCLVNNLILQSLLLVVNHLNLLSKWTPSSRDACYQLFKPTPSLIHHNYIVERSILFMNHCLRRSSSLYQKYLVQRTHSKRSLLTPSARTPSLLPSQPSLLHHRPLSSSPTKLRLLSSPLIQSASSLSATVTREAQKSCSLRHLSIMAPINGDKPTIETIDNLVKDNRIMIFSKTTCPFCTKVKGLFTELNQSFKVMELDTDENGSEIQSLLQSKTGKKTVPQVFVNGVLVGGCDDTFAAKESGKLSDMLKTHTFDYDLIVIGGGSGGLAASKEAARFGKKVAVFDFVKPTPKGASWGLGGTCVNVGCIPKKLMHQAALIGGYIKDANSFGWTLTRKDAETGVQVDEPMDMGVNVRHDWQKMVQEIQMYIKSLNFGYRVNLREKSVNYVNAYASFIDNHTIETTDKKGKVTLVTSDKFIIATGERPRYPMDVNGHEHGITSDDLFSLNYNPGKTLLVGASYVSLECAGFLHGIGNDVTVMVRSILLRGFDQEIAERIGKYMKEIEGIKFIRPAVPISVEVIEEGVTDADGNYVPGTLKVTYKIVDTNEEVSEEFNSVIWAIGRDPCTTTIGLDKVGVRLNEKTRKVIVNEKEETTIDNIYAIGDILQDRLELTPVAIEAGKLLSRRLYGGGHRLCDYVNVPTTVFTPIEYGAVGYSEERAMQLFGAANIEVYHQGFLPLEWTLPHRDKDTCWSKLIVIKSEKRIVRGPDGAGIEQEIKERVVGFHYLGPNAGEVTQMAALPLKMGATKEDFDALIGIHPTCAETFTTLTVTKSSGADAAQKGC